MIGWLKKKLTQYFLVVFLGAALGAGLLVLPVSRSAARQDDVPTPRWPLDLPTRYLTSNFMEYRPGRFHAGLDLKTRSQEGFPVYAVEDGWLQRVRATPRAYGRAVYLQGQSGKTYVYAHLSRFNDQIRARVDAARGGSGRYEASFYLEPGAWPVRRGEILGLSGQSGTGGPHLHFEVRDAQQRPLNPLDCGFAVDDTFPPVFEAIRAVPVQPTSLLEGTAGARLLDLGSQPPADGGRRELPALRLQGPVAFAARVTDRSDIRGHRLEPWLLEARLDGVLVYRCRNESYAFDQNSQQRLEWLDLPGCREHWLHRRAGNELPGRWGDLWYLGKDGQGLPPGEHELAVYAGDRAGNGQEVVIPLMVLDGQANGSPLEGTPTAWQSASLGVCPGNVIEGSTTILTPFFEILGEGSEALSRRRLDPERGDPVLAPVTLWTLAADWDSLAVRQAAGQGLTPAGPAAEFLAADWPIEAEILVEFPADPVERAESALPGEDPRCGVYRWHQNQWQYAAAFLESGRGGASGRFALADPGLHAVFLDTLAPCFERFEQPLVVAPGPQNGLPGVTPPRWEVLAIGMADAGSGLDPATLRATLDDEPWVVEPDLPRDRILVELPAALAPGSHSLWVEVADGAQNRTACVIELFCRE